MKVWGIDAETLETIKNNVSREYGGNVRWKRIPEPTGKAISFTLTVVSSHGDGSRRSNEGRKIAAACWHVHRDLFERIFSENPDARIKTAMADYKGEKDFSYKYPETGNTNVGSIANPLFADEACNCC